MDYIQRNKSFIQRRVDGASFPAIGAEFGVTASCVRAAIAKAYKRGEVTAHQIRYKPRGPSRRKLPDSEYNQKWLARLAKRSRPGANGCIEADYFHNADGYVILFHRSLGDFAHRIVVILNGRPIPPGMMACHRCGNHGCVNDAHLYVGTMKQNARDTVNHGRHPETKKTHCIHGHPFDETNTRVCKRGKRHCKTCERARLKLPHYREAANRRQRINRRLRRLAFKSRESL
jgi:hypothetical protein